MIPSCNRSGCDSNPSSRGLRPQSPSRAVICETHNVVVGVSSVCEAELTASPLAGSRALLPYCNRHYVAPYAAPRPLGRARLHAPALQYSRHTTPSSRRASQYPMVEGSKRLAVTSASIRVRFLPTIGMHAYRPGNMRFSARIGRVLCLIRRAK